MTPDHKKWIDESSYESLLRRWRFAEVGDPIFQGETGEYYIQIMKKRKQEIGDVLAVQASKLVGWENLQGGRES